MNLALPIVLAVLIPAGISFFVLLAGWAGLRRTTNPALLALVVLLAVGIGYIAGHLWVSGWPGFPPADATHWLPFIAAAALVVGAACELANRAAMTWAGRCAIALAVAAALSSSLGKSQQGSTAIVAGLLVFAAQLVVFWATEVMHTHLARPLFCLAQLAWCVDIAVALVLARSAMLGQVGGALAAAVGPLVLFAVILRRQLVHFRSAGWIVVPVIVGLLLVGTQFSYMPIAAGALIAAAPIVCALILIAGRRMPLFAQWAGLLLFCLIVGVALVIVTRALPPIDVSEF
jgi:hypothetical protein